MGLFGFLKQIRRSSSAGGNFAFIAQNVATIYYAIGETSYGKRMDDEKRLFATGYLDVISYINDGSLTPKDIRNSIILGTIGKVSLDFYEREHRAFMEHEDNYRLVGFTMQLEAFIFDASNTGVDYRSIVDAVVEQKNNIANMINRTLEEGRESPLYKDVYTNISRWLSDPRITNVIDEWTIRE